MSSQVLREQCKHNKYECKYEPNTHVSTLFGGSVEHLAGAMVGRSLGM